MEKESILSVEDEERKNALDQISDIRTKVGYITWGAHTRIQYIFCARDIN